MSKNYSFLKDQVALYGHETASMADLLTLILGSKADGSVVQSIMAEGLAGLITMSKEDLREAGLTPLMSERLLAAMEFGKKIAIESIRTSEYTINQPEDAANYLMEELRFLNQEHFVALYLNTKNQVIRKKTVFIGSLNAALVHPREIFCEAVKVSAAGIIVAHNHPSGQCQASREDIEVTKRLVDCGTLMGIELLDHIIIGDRKYSSLKQKGYL